MIVELPEIGTGDHRFKNWTRYVTAVDPGQTKGFAYQGPWLDSETADLPAWSLILTYRETGSWKNRDVEVILWQLTPDGTWDQLGRSVRPRDWALDLRPAAEHAFADAAQPWTLDVTIRLRASEDAELPDLVDYADDIAAAITELLPDGVTAEVAQP